mgnify:FL=1
MFDLKPYGAFIENTIRPLLEEIRLILSDLEDKGIKIDESRIESLIKRIANYHFKVILTQSITGVILCGLICLTVWKTLQ